VHEFGLVPTADAFDIGGRKDVPGFLIWVHGSGRLGRVGGRGFLAPEGQAGEGGIVVCEVGFAGYVRLSADVGEGDSLLL
jgi:hypothetical protein